MLLFISNVFLDMVLLYTEKRKNRYQGDKVEDEDIEP